jgi:hypothetical protein
MKIKIFICLFVLMSMQQNIYSEVMSEKETVEFYSEAFKERLNKKDYVELRNGKDITDCRLLMYDGHRPYLARFFDVDNEKSLEFLGTKGNHRIYFEGKDLIDFMVKLDENIWSEIEKQLEKIKKQKFNAVKKKWSHKYQLRCIYKGEEFSFEEYDNGQESEFIDFAKQMQKLIIEQFLYGPIKRWSGILYKVDAFFSSNKCGYIQMMELPCDPKKNQDEDYLSIFWPRGYANAGLIRITHNRKNKKTEAIVNNLMQNERNRGIPAKVLELNENEWEKIKNLYFQKKEYLKKTEDYNKYSILANYNEIEIEHCSGLNCETLKSGWSYWDIENVTDLKKRKNYYYFNFYESLRDVIFEAYDRERSKKEKK